MSGFSGKNLIIVWIRTLVATVVCRPINPTRREPRHFQVICRGFLLRLGAYGLINAPDTTKHGAYSRTDTELTGPQFGGNPAIMDKFYSPKSVLGQRIVNPDTPTKSGTRKNLNFRMDISRNTSIFEGFFVHVTLLQFLRMPRLIKTAFVI